MRRWVVRAVWLVLVGCAQDPKDGGADSSGDRDSDGVPDGADCDPDEPAVRPGGAGVGDGLDNNCNGQIDELFDLD